MFNKLFNHNAPPDPDLTTEEGVIELMELCQTSDDWCEATQAIKKANDGTYPAVIANGLGNRISARWGGSTAIRIS